MVEEQTEAVKLIAQKRGSKRRKFQAKVQKAEGQAMAPVFLTHGQECANYLA